MSGRFLRTLIIAVPAFATTLPAIANDKTPRPGVDPVKQCIADATNDFFLRQQKLQIAKLTEAKSMADEVIASLKAANEAQPKDKRGLNLDPEVFLSYGEGMKLAQESLSLAKKNIPEIEKAAPLTNKDKIGFGDTSTELRVAIRFNEPRPIMVREENIDIIIQANALAAEINHFPGNSEDIPAAKLDFALGFNASHVKINVNSMEISDGKNFDLLPSDEEVEFITLGPNFSTEEFNSPLPKKKSEDLIKADPNDSVEDLLHALKKCGLRKTVGFFPGMN